MPIEKETLEVIARTYVGTMTSIRGRRVHRLLMREFSRFDHVLPAVAEDGTPALLAPNVKDAVDRSIQIGKIDAIIFGCMHSTDHDVSKDQEARWWTGDYRVDERLVINCFVTTEAVAFG